MRGVEDSVVLKGGKIGKERVCDCTIFDGEHDVSVSLVEPKSRMPHASEIAEKLTNGGKRAKSMLEQEGLRVGKATAVILARRFHRHDYAVLKTRRS